MAVQGTNTWLLEHMVTSQEQTSLQVTFACGHEFPIFQVAVQAGMQQTINDRLHRYGVRCHTCQYFALVDEVKEEHYVDVLKKVGNDPTAAPTNFDLLQMYYDMAQTFAQRVNEEQSTDVMNQCLDEFCRRIIDRLSPHQRKAGLDALLTLQMEHEETGQSGGHVNIVRRLTKAITNVDAMDLDSNGTPPPQPGGSKQPPGPDDDLSSSVRKDLERRPAILGPNPPGSSPSSKTDTPVRQDPSSDPPEGPPSSPSAQAAERRKANAEQTAGEVSSSTKLEPQGGHVDDEMSVFGSSPPHLPGEEPATLQKPLSAIPKHMQSSLKKTPSPKGSGSGGSSDSDEVL
ncbi:hypothetical protein PG994_004600 [Apiospora phragmitis]|uniref:Uncharacterized protein n=1 Tax=Apiospora phragmitis TaxID=2905665 RepID=A0ABR1VTP2_9PEZI